MKGGNQSRVSTVSLGRLQYIRWGTADPTERRIIIIIRRRRRTFPSITCCRRQFLHKM
jgi:hypothetical protein